MIAASQRRRRPRHTSRPSMSGSPRSSSTTSAAAAARACAPVPTTSTWYPAPVSPRAIEFAIPGSSSTTKAWIRRPPPLPLAVTGPPYDARAGTRLRSTGGKRPGPSAGAAARQSGVPEICVLVQCQSLISGAAQHGAAGAVLRGGNFSLMTGLRAQGRIRRLAVVAFTVAALGASGVSAAAAATSTGSTAAKPVAGSSAKRAATPAAKTATQKAAPQKTAAPKVRPHAFSLPEQPGLAGKFVAAGPTRLLDTRKGLGTGGVVAPVGQVPLLLDVSQVAG